MHGKPCTVDACDLLSTPRTPFCKNCGASISGWTRRKPSEIVRRHKNLAKYSRRLLLTVDRKGVKL